jgi:thiol-disulfide isomerase/thioredoxin
VRIGSLLAVLAVAGLTVTACLGHRGLAVGEAADGFSLPALSRPGGDVTLSHYQGRPVILNFFASWSPPCHAETPLLARFYRAHHGRVQIIGMDSQDERSAALSLLRRSRVTYPVAADPARATASRYGAPGIPATYFLNARHQIVKIDFGWLSWRKLRTGLRAMNAS